MDVWFRLFLRVCAGKISSVISEPVYRAKMGTGNGSVLIYSFMFVVRSFPDTIRYGRLYDSVFIAPVFPGSFYNSQNQIGTFFSFAPPSDSDRCIGTDDSGNPECQFSSVLSDRRGLCRTISGKI